MGIVGAEADAFPRIVDAARLFGEDVKHLAEDAHAVVVGGGGVVDVVPVERDMRLPM